MLPTKPSTNNEKLSAALAQLQRLKYMNDMLEEETRIAKATLSSALAKLGVQWSAHSQDYTVAEKIDTLPSMVKVEQALVTSENQRASALHSLTQMRQSIEQLLRDRNDLLFTLTLQFPKKSYRCQINDHTALVIDTHLGSACWFLDDTEQQRFNHLLEKAPPKRLLNHSQRTEAITTLSGAIQPD